MRRRALDRLRTCLLLALLALASLPVMAVHAQQSAPPDLATYESWLRAALVAAQRNDRLGLEQEAARLTSTRAVQVGSAQVPVDNSWLAAATDTAEPNLNTIATQLEAILNALAQAQQAPPAEAQQALAGILNAPPFVSEEPQENLLSAFLDWIFEWLDALFGPAFDAGTTTGSVLGWLLIGLCALLLAGVLTYLALSLRRSVTSEATAVPDEDPEAGLTAMTAFQQAGVLAQGGDYRTAVRYLYLSSLLWLDEGGLLRYDRALTNREYLDRLRDNPNLRAHLLPIVETFDQVWYGYATLDADSFQAYRRQVEALRRQS